jgi:ribosomal-protein-serine acetyltransferase
VTRTTPADRLVADGLHLVRWRPRDVPALTDAIHASLAHLAAWLPWVAVYDVDPHAADGFVEAVDRAWADGTEWSWGVWERGVLVGAAGMHTRGDPHVREVGYWTHVDHLGQGIARRAAGAVTREAFRLDGVTRCEIRHGDTNERSARIPAHLGYRWVGTVPRGPGEGGDAHRTVVWALDRDDAAGAPVMEQPSVDPGST